MMLSPFQFGAIEVSSDDERYMLRCLELASITSGQTAPNPMVGAVLVHQGRIIGEGYHHRSGEAHAEVNCIRSVRPEDQQLLNQSTLYVSLEPCAHHGKTPPCADLIIEKRIPRVVVGCRDPFVQVDGKGIEKLRQAGVNVQEGILASAALELNKRFMTFHTDHRPYILLKWAQSADGRIAGAGPGRVYITNAYTNRLVHKWRTEESSILVGTHTALYDDPALTARFWEGENPVRLVVDMDLRLPDKLQLFDRQVKTIVFNTRKHEEHPGLLYYQVSRDAELVHQMVHALYHQQILSVMVEGGATLLQSFIDQDLWDEARIITNGSMRIPDGLPAPVLPAGRGRMGERFFDDQVEYFRRNQWSGQSSLL